jgi:L-ascorbate metabolism protein UlaG (beta-lactamase superfamily)
MIEPYLKEDEFLADIDIARLEPEKLHMWWMGQSGFLILWQGSALLLDPYLSDTLTKKYAGSDKPHVRMTARVIDPERLDFINAVTSSHNHTDHLDGETLTALLNANPELVLVVPEANREFAAQRLQISPEKLTGITLERPVQIGPFCIFALPAAHENLEVDDQGHHKYHSYVIQVGTWTVYHAGDGVPYEGLAERLQPFQIDIALLPINGRDPQRGVAGNFTGQEAVELGYNSQAGLVIPMHYDMFEFNTVTPDEFVQACQDLHLAYRVLQNGERASF